MRLKHPEKIREAYEAKGMSQADVARALGVSRQQLNNVLQGRYALKGHQAVRLSSKFTSVEIALALHSFD